MCASFLYLHRTSHYDTHHTPAAQANIAAIPTLPIISGTAAPDVGTLVTLMVGEIVLIVVMTAEVNGTPPEVLLAPLKAGS